MTNTREPVEVTVPASETAPGDRSERVVKASADSRIEASSAPPEASAPWDQYYQQGVELRPAPARVRPTSIWKEARERLYGPFFEVLDVPEETPLTRLAADQLWEGDRYMDPVAGLFSTMGPRARAMVEQALEFGIESVEDPPAELVDLFAHLDRVPDWMDWERFERGRQLLADVSPLSVVGLAVLDVLITGVGEEVSWAVGATGRLVRDPERRNLESLSWFAGITRPQSFDRFGEVFKDTVRVRLMHSLVRRGLKKKWDSEFLAHHGNPISSAHMAAGASTFGLALLLYDMREGRSYSGVDLEDASMFWAYVVYVFGAREDVIPKTADENMRLGDYMLMTMGEPTEWTPELTDGVFYAQLGPLLDHKNPVVRLLGRQVAFPWLIGLVQYIAGPGLAHLLVRPEYERDFRNWERFARVQAFLFVLDKRVSDRLPKKAERREKRTRDGEPVQRLAFKALSKLNAEHSGFQSHDGSADGQDFAPKGPRTAA